MDYRYKYIGERTPRKDAIGKVTGLTKYTLDMKFPGMLQMRFLRSKYPHANIKSFDLSKALAVPGVVKIYTYEDVLEKYGYAPTEPGGYPNVVMLDKRVRYTGDLVAAVVAIDNATAEKALDLIEVEYEVLPAALTIDEAIAEDAPIIHPEWETQGYDNDPAHPLDPDYVVTSNIIPTYMIVDHNVGDIDAAFKEADVIVENTFYYDGYQPHICLEPHCGVAVPEGERVIVYMSGQSLFGTKSAYDKFFGLGKVEIIMPPCGGAFGSKHDATRENCIIALAAMELGRPVANMPTREEEYINYLHRCGMKSTWKLGAKKDGSIIALDCINYCDCGGYNYGVRCACAQAIISSEMITKCPNQRYKILPVFTNTSPGGAYRGYGFFEGSFALGSAVLKMAEQLDLDPMEVFLKNGIEPGDEHLDFQLGHIKTVTSGSMKSLGDAGEKFHWNERWTGWNKPVREDEKTATGVGFGVCVAPRGGMPASVTLSIYGDGSAKISAAVTEIGQGTQTALSKLVAEELNISIDKVDFSEISTRSVPYTPVGQAESRSIVDFGNCLMKAISEIKRQLFELGGQVLGCSPDDLDSIDDYVFMKENPEVGIPWLYLFGFTKCAITVAADNVEHVDGLKYPHAVPFTFFELDVDKETGEIKINDYLGGVDAGKIINPTALTAMYEGGSLQGQGFVTREKLYIDKKTGKVLNGNMIFCGGATVYDHPEKVEFSFPELELDPLTPHGFKGEGEGSNSPSWGMMLAFRNATGKWPDTMPITPKEVLDLLREE